jgi:hypothetical protein
MADDAAEHDADNGSVESDETVATVDERDLPLDDAGGAGGDGGGGDDVLSENEADESDGNGDGESTFRVREVECGKTILVIVDISLPGRLGGKPRPQSFLFLRQCEELLYGSTAGSYTGALHAAVKVTGFENTFRPRTVPPRSHRRHVRAEHGARELAACDGEGNRPAGHGGA